MNEGIIRGARNQQERDSDAEWEAHLNGDCIEDCRHCLKCRNCGSRLIIQVPFDHGTDRDGYRQAGVHCTCVDCCNEWDAEE